MIATIRRGREQNLFGVREGVHDMTPGLCGRVVSLVKEEDVKKVGWWAWDAIQRRTDAMRCCDHGVECSQSIPFVRGADSMDKFMRAGAWRRRKSQVMTRKTSLRIAKSAFAFARREGRRRVTAIHKANILKLSRGLFLRCCRRVARDYPEIQYDELIVNNTAMQLVTRPDTLDVLLMPNLYGDILSDLAAGLVGGLGIVPGANLGETHAVFEAIHSSEPDIAGKGIANPTGLMQSAVLLLRHLGERAAAERLHAAIRKVYATRRSLTPDVGGSSSTSEFTDAVVHNLEVSAGE